MAVHSKRVEFHKYPKMTQDEFIKREYFEQEYTPDWINFLVYLWLQVTKSVNQMLSQWVNDHGRLSGQL